jgi:hypothetical protein
MLLLDFPMLIVISLSVKLSETAGDYESAEIALRPPAGLLTSTSPD